VTGDWRKLHNERLHNLYDSPHKIRMIRSRRISWAGHVAGVERRECMQGFGGKTRRKETTEKT
jgi:hypothetical protein